MVASLFQIQFEKALKKRLQELTTEVMAEAINWSRKGRKPRQKVVLVTWKMSYNLIRFFEELSTVCQVSTFSLLQFVVYTARLFRTSKCGKILITDAFACVFLAHFFVLAIIQDYCNVLLCVTVMC